MTVGYEQARGRRKKHQKPGGYEISKSKTLDASVESAFEAWRDGRKRARWMADPRFTIRKAAQNRSLRITWVDGATHVTVNFYDRARESARLQFSTGSLPTGRRPGGRRQENLLGPRDGEAGQLSCA